MARPARVEPQACPGGEAVLQAAALASQPPSIRNPVASPARVVRGAFAVPPPTLLRVARERRGEEGVPEAQGAAPPALPPLEGAQPTERGEGCACSPEAAPTQVVTFRVRLEGSPPPGAHRSSVTRRLDTGCKKCAVESLPPLGVVHVEPSEALARYCEAVYSKGPSAGGRERDTPPKDTAPHMPFAGPL